MVAPFLYFCNMKMCNKCNELKPVGDFYKRKNNTGEVITYCKECANAINKDYRQKNKDAISERKKQHYQENKEYILSRNKKYREENRERLSEVYKKYNDKNKYSKLAYNREYRKMKILTDPLWRPVQALRSRMYKFCKSISVEKDFKTLDSVGLSRNDFKVYIESLFTDGMTWDNYGYGEDKWNIDHIKPLRLANSVEEVYSLNHYTNLQPMWSLDNFSKGGKYQEQ